MNLDAIQREIRDALKACLVWPDSLDLSVMQEHIAGAWLNCRERDSKELSTFVKEWLHFNGILR